VKVLLSFVAMQPVVKIPFTETTFSASSRDRLNMFIVDLRGEEKNISYCFPKYRDKCCRWCLCLAAICAPTRSDGVLLSWNTCKGKQTKDA
jgi:hypothetical protein